MAEWLMKSCTVSSLRPGFRLSMELFLKNLTFFSCWKKQLCMLHMFMILVFAEA